MTQRPRPQHFTPALPFESSFAHLVREMLEDAALRARSGAEAIAIGAHMAKSLDGWRLAALSASLKMWEIVHEEGRKHAKR